MHAKHAIVACSLSLLAPAVVQADASTKPSPKEMDAQLHREFGVTKFAPPKGCNYHVVMAGIYHKTRGIGNSTKVISLKFGASHQSSKTHTGWWTNSVTVKPGYVLCSYRQAGKYPVQVACTPGPLGENLPWQAFELKGDRVRFARTVACTSTIQLPYTGERSPVLSRFEAYARKKTKPHR
jgi:hypothetical protein